MQSRDGTPERGHSLIELMVVLVLVGLIAALAAPAVLKSARTPTDALSGARRAAILAGRDSIVLIRPEGNGSSVVLRVRPDGSRIRAAEVRFAAHATEPLP